MSLSSTTRISVLSVHGNPGMRPTLEICALFLAEPSARLLHPCRKIDLDIPRHGLVGTAYLAARLGLAHQLLDALYAAAALVKPPRDFLCQPLDLAFLGPLRLIVVEARQYMLLVQPVQLLALFRNVGQQLRHLIGHVRPSRWEQVHLDHRIAVVHIVGPRRQETSPVLVRGEQHPRAHPAAAAEAAAPAGQAIPVALGRMVGVGLPVRDVAVRGVSSVCRALRTGAWGWPYRFVRSRHMANAGRGFEIPSVRPGC